MSSGRIVFLFFQCISREDFIDEQLRQTELLNQVLPLHWHLLFRVNFSPLSLATRIMQHAPHYLAVKNSGDCRLKREAGTHSKYANEGRLTRPMFNLISNAFQDSCNKARLSCSSNVHIENDASKIMRRQEMIG